MKSCQGEPGYLALVDVQSSHSIYLHSVRPFLDGVDDCTFETYVFYNQALEDFRTRDAGSDIGQDVVVGSTDFDGPVSRHVVEMVRTDVGTVCNKYLTSIC